MDLRCLWCSSISCLVQMNFTRPPDGWGLPEISVNPFEWPWNHSIREPPLKKRDKPVFQCKTQEALAAADRHQAGQSAATAAFCLWKGNCFLVASIVERLQRRHFEHKWHYSNSRNLRRLFWKVYLDKNHPSKTTYNTIIILYNIQAICRFASQRVNCRNCKLFSFQRLQASSKVSCSSAGRDRSTSGPFRAEAQGISGKLGLLSKCSKFCESRNRRKYPILSKRCWTQNDFTYFHLYYLYVSMSYFHLVVRMFTSGDPTSVAWNCRRRNVSNVPPIAHFPHRRRPESYYATRPPWASDVHNWYIPFSGFQSQNISHLKQDCDTHLQSFFHIFIIRRFAFV